jgi:CRP-like cAMP-binding protein
MVFDYLIVPIETKLERMRHIIVSGNWQRSVELIDLVHQAGHLVSLSPPIGPSGSADLLVACLTSPTDIGAASEAGLPWLAWSVSSDESLIPLAYQAGAQAVFPENTPATILFTFIQRYLEKNRNESLPEPLEKAIQRRYQKGDTILLEAGSVLEVQQGIIAQTMVLQDGSEVLLGLFGPHNLVVPHPEDSCYIQLVAHTNASIVIQSWQTAVMDSLFPNKLRARLQQMEAWAAMQTRPHLDQRVLGILSLLAEQFGEERENGKTVMVRITHLQLASAVGATRTTITRTLGDLKNQGRLSIIQTKDGERFCLPIWEPGHHSLQDNG